MSLKERCELGMADPRVRCGNPSRYASLDIGEDGDNDVVVPHEIAGRVMSAEGYGVPGISLVASRIDAAADADGSRDDGETYRHYQAVSSGDGSYVFSEIPEGDYVIRSGEVGDYGSTRISARTGTGYADIVLVEEREIVVEGRVTDSTGSPLSHVTVLPVVEGVPSVSTDRSGWYRLPVSLPPKSNHLTLRFKASGMNEVEARASLPLKAGIMDARGVSRVELDAVMEPISLTTNVRGTITTPEGDPVRGRVVELLAKGQRRYRAVSNRRGEYEFPVVPAPSEYRLRVTGFPDYPDYHSSVMVTSDDYEFDVLMESYDVGTLRGRIVDADGGAIPDVELALTNNRSSQPNALVRSDAFGGFVLRYAPAGEVVLASRSMPTFVVSGVEVPSGRESNIDVVVDWGHHELSGTIVDRTGRAVSGSQVLLKWSHESAGGVQSSVTRRTATDYQGRFRFDQLGAGPHSLVVHATGYEKMAFEHDIRRDGYDVTVQLN
jgi:protocatechuate 3,4-dioxygenase beta subunit